MNRTKRVLKWNDDRSRQVKEIALLGATDEQMAKIMGIDINTLNLWKRTHHEFIEAMQAGKDLADIKIVKSWYKRAKGFWMWENHVCMYRGVVIQTPVRKYYPPDVMAATKWMALRQRTKWAEVTKIESTQTNININKIDFTGLSTDELLLMKQIHEKQKRLALNENGISQN
jgi:hypothetical protein